MPSTLSPQEFVRKWARVSQNERSAAQPHFLDLCRLLGETPPQEQDPAGAWYRFEAGAGKTGGGEGFADVWKRGYFAWEYKGPHANLDKAYEQLLKYHEALENPPLLVVSDMQTIEVHTNFTNSPVQVLRFALDDLLDPRKLDQLRNVFHNPQAFYRAMTPEDVTQQAAKDFARLAAYLREKTDDGQRVAHFLIRLLFCLFAEDIGLLPRGLFSRLVRQTRQAPAAFVRQLRQLFAAMAEGGWFGTEEIRHFDGGLFEDDAALALDERGFDALLAVADLDWASIEPSILGVLFERSLDPDKRSQLGAHYTGRDDILLIVEPVLMAPLRREWETAKREAQELAARRDAATTTQARNRWRDELRQKIEKFAARLASVQVLDPACGSGNFLYVSLRQLLDLWHEVAACGAQLGLTAMTPLQGQAPYPSQLHGIEVNPYAHELAQATIWIGYLQWLREHGYGFPADPVLKPLHNILRMDAILAYDAQGKAVEPEWPAAEVIVGNPPFLGGNKVRQELGDRYVEDLFALYRDRVPAFADLVCYWFEKARAMIEQGQAKRAGLLATQGIRGGVNRVALERIKKTGDIFWAQSDRDWVLDGANVHVSMVGFDSGVEQDHTLDGRPAPQINSDLTAQTNLSQAQPLVENEDIGFRGNQKGGPFDIPEDLALSMLSAKGNPNGRPNSDVVRPWANGMDITRRPRHMWLIDFGLDMSLDDAAQYELPFEHVRANVYPVRGRKKEWWIHERPRPSMRAAIEPLARFIVTPHVSKHRLFVWFRNETVPDHELIVIAREDDYFFGVLQARSHELWALRQGTQLEDRPRYTPTTTFETYPFPWPPGQEPAGDARVEAIAQAARELVAKRDAWLNPPGAAEAELKRRTLTNLYNQRPAWLEMAHGKLDRAVFAAYGWPLDLTDEEILERLLALNLERSKPD